MEDEDLSNFLFRTMENKFTLSGEMDNETFDNSPDAGDDCNDESRDIVPCKVTLSKTMSNTAFHSSLDTDENCNESKDHVHCKSKLSRGMEEDGVFGISLDLEDSYDESRDIVPDVKIDDVNKSLRNSQYLETNSIDTLDGVPYAWKMLSKKRSSTQKEKKPTKWNKIKDNLKVVNFMKSLATKNVSKLKRDLELNPFLTTYTDDKGVTSLEKAVSTENLDILELFIDNSSKSQRGDILEHAILYAIQQDLITSVKFLLKNREKFWEEKQQENNVPVYKERRSKSMPLQKLLHFKVKESEKPSPKIKNLQNKTKESEKASPKLKHMEEETTDVTITITESKPQELTGFEDAAFSSYTTPIILAAKLQRLDIIKLLIDRDASEIHPMTVKCPYDYVSDCDICNERKMFKSSRNLEDSNRMIEIYRALSSPAFIFISGVPDPVLEAFEISKELDHMQEEDPSFKCEYEELSIRCRSFATELLNLCRTTEEVEILLRREEGVKNCDRCGGRTGLSRVIVAMNYDQKEFIAHPYCQQVLQKSWYKGLPKWVHETEYHYTTLFMYYLLWIPCWPIACFLFMMKISPWVVNIMKYPINKFITDTYSFLTFLLLLVLNNLYFNHRNQKAGELFNLAEFLIIFWTIGLAARQFKMFWRHRNPWKRLDFSAINRDTRWSDGGIAMFFLLWIVSRLIGMIYAHSTGQSEQMRSNWHPGHPILIAEASYSIGTVIAFFKVTGLFTSSSTLGPMQISLSKMVRDILRFLTIFIVIMFGFIMAITNLTSNYAGNINSDTVDENLSEFGYEYVGFMNTTNTLFWHIFGYGDVSFASILSNHTEEQYIQSVIPDHSNSSSTIASVSKHVPQDGPKYNHHAFTEFIGYGLLGTYHIVTIVVLMNMLIAMMNNSYQSIVMDSDKEWKFARTRLRMNYYNEVGSIPPPFNIFLIGTMMKYIVGWCGKCSPYCKSLDELYETRKNGTVREAKNEYKNLMDKLSKRYWNKKSVQKSQDITISPEAFETLMTGGNRISSLLKDSSEA